MNLLKQHVVLQRNLRIRHQEKQCSHSIAFPAMMSALKTLLCLPAQENISGLHQNIDKDGYDYFFQMGISGEGFGMMTDVSDTIRVFGQEILTDCFSSEGISFHHEEYGGFEEDTRNKINIHLESERPVMLLYGGKCPGTAISLGTEVCCSSGILFQNAGFSQEKEKRLIENSRINRLINSKLNYVIYIDDTCKPASRRDIIIHALKRGYKMMTSDIYQHGYGYGKNIWRTWISRLDNNKNYVASRSRFKYISPEIFDVSSRRASMVKFFIGSENYLGQDSLLTAREAFRDIFYDMRQINILVSGENYGDLRNRSTRDQVISLIDHCSLLEEKAAENIKEIVEDF